jgi:WD40 repeat protein
MQFFSKIFCLSSTVLSLIVLGIGLGRETIADMFSSSETSKSSHQSFSTRTLKGHLTWIYALAISPDGRLLASGGYDKTIRIWNLSSGQLLYAIKAHGDAIDSLVFSQDGKTLVSGSWDNRVKLWNPNTGKLIRTLTGHLLLNV